MSYLYIETNGHEFTFGRHNWFELPRGKFRHWLLEKKRTYQVSMSEARSAA